MYIYMYIIRAHADQRKWLVPEPGVEPG